MSFNAHVLSLGDRGTTVQNNGEQEASNCQGLKSAIEGGEHAETDGIIAIEPAEEMQTSAEAGWRDQKDHR
jgi:hypothetical protein